MVLLRIGPTALKEQFPDRPADRHHEPSIDVSTSTEKVAPVRKLRCACARRDAGGGGVNVARVVTRLGGRCRALYPAGGVAGRLLHRLLEDEGVASIVIEIASETRENFSVVDQSSDPVLRAQREAGQHSLDRPQEP